MRLVRIAAAQRLAAICLLALFTATTAGPGRTYAAAVSPRLLESVRGTPAEARVLRSAQRYEESKQLGVDHVYPAFALDMARYPQGGVGHRNVLVVLAQFPAEGSSPAARPSSASTPPYFYRLFFSNDPNDGIISMREYYEANSKGRFVISGQVTSEWIDMPHSEQYYVDGQNGLYGDYPNNALKLAEDAMAAAFRHFDQNLSYFDNDGPDGVPSSGDDDGYIDAVCIIHPGQGAEVSGSDNDFWSHESGVAVYSNCPSPSGGPGCLPGVSLGNVRGFLYTVVPEFNEFPGDKASGTWFHEFGHTLGLPDLYGSGQSAGLGYFSLMALGNYLPNGMDANVPAGGPLGSRAANLDPWCRQYLGFEHPAAPDTGGHFTLPPVSSGGGSIRLWTNGQSGSEYFLVENRIRAGSDAYLPGQGLLVYHVNDLQIDNQGGYPNYRVACVQADSVKPLQLESSLAGYKNFGDASDPFPGALLKRSLTSTTSPNSRSYSNANTGIQIYNIVGAADGSDTASFDLALSTAPSIQLDGYVLGDGGDGFADENERDSLTVSIRNVGLPSASLSLTLSTSDPNVTVVQGASSAPSLPTDGSATGSAPFVFDVGSIASLPHTITFTLGWSDGGHSGSNNLTVTVGLSSGLTENFETAAEPGTYWSEGPVSGSASEWHSSTSRAHGGSRSAKLGSSNALGVGTNLAQTYAPLQDAALVSPAFGLAPGSELVFYSYIDAATNGGTGAWDGGRVEISIDGGAWTPLQVDDGYGYVIEFNSPAALHGSLAFSGSPQSWRRVTADLSQFSGEARVRFRFASEDGLDYPLWSTGSLARYYEGWYVDDVSIQTRTATGPRPRLLSLRGGPNPYWAGGLSTGPFTFRFSAPDGLPHPGTYPTLRIFDIHGRLVRTLTASPSSLVPSEFQATWNAENNSGQGCGAGLYFAKVDIQGRSENLRVVVVR